MSVRGMRLFENYVTKRLTDPNLSGLSSEDHAANLVAEAEAAGISVLEITEEVGAIADALAVVKINKERAASGSQEVGKRRI